MSQVLADVGRGNARSAVRRYSSELYNSLPSVESQDAERKARLSDFDALVSNARELFRSYGANQYLGLGLQHRHHLVGSSEAMMHSPGVTPNGVRALVAKRQTISEEDAPLSFAVDGEGKLVPIEFGTDSCLVDVTNFLGENERFVEAACKLIESHGLSNLIGITVVSRNDFIVSPGSILVEVSDHNIARSYLVPTPIAEVDYDHLIQTSWGFNGSDGANCQLSCQTVCEDRSPGHGSVHRSGHYT